MMDHFCLDIPLMQGRRGIIAWTTRVYLDSSRTDGIVEELVPVHYMKIIKKLENSTKPYATLAEDNNVKALEWHPGNRALQKDATYQACISNQHHHYVYLHVALVETWPKI